MYLSHPPVTWLDSNVSDSIVIGKSPSNSGSLAKNKCPAISAVRFVQKWFIENSTDKPGKIISIPFVPFILRFGLLENCEEDLSSEDCSVEYEDECIKSVLHQQSSMFDDLPSEQGETNKSCSNYIITQMDVSRMARNASRHLGVKSILSLPTIIYHSEEEPRMPALQDDLAVTSSLDGWSWQMVSPQLSDEYTAADEPPPRTPKTCVICLEAFHDGDTVRVLPCSHLFHIGCIDHWRLSTHTEDESAVSGCLGCRKCTVIDEEDIPSPTDGSLPSWAFCRLGDVLANKQQEEAATATATRESNPPADVVTVDYTKDDLATSSLSVSEMVSKK